MLDKTKLISIGKGALIAGIGALLASLIEASPTVDLGAWGPLVAALLAVLANTVRKIGPSS